MTSKRGEEILAELERRTGQGSMRQGEGEQEFYLNAPGVGVDGFDAMLNKIDPAWEAHLIRTVE